MARYTAICEYVQDGDTFCTQKQNWIRLARFNAPEEDKPNYARAKKFLSALILHKEIVYEQTGTSSGRIVAEVWLGGVNINDVMIQSRYWG
jgi:endonuclease YncB( thermonuclease family)